MVRLQRSARPRPVRGFTLVELMVAVTGGLFVAIAVFVLARDGSRFYRQQARVADATLGAVVGFNRLKADLSRSGFMSSPNIRQDPFRCETPDDSWPNALRNLASLRLPASTDAVPAVLRANGRNPDSIVLAGNYANSDEFPTWGVVLAGSTYVVTLQTRIGPLPRLGYLGMTDDQRKALLQGIFRPDRALRIVDQSGKSHYGSIQSAQVAGGDPQIVLDVIPPLNLRDTNARGCALAGSQTASASVVNFIRYRIRDMRSDPDYRSLFDDSSAGEIAAWEAGRTELVREELRVDGTPLDTAPDKTVEIVAEYAVDLKFALTVVTGTTRTANQTEVTALTTYPFGDAHIAGIASNPASASFAPQTIRSVRARLSVRSRVPDRQAAIVGQSGTSVAPGFYRIELTPGVFARVRTLQADVALPNHGGITW
jgi:hypothetical protein